MVKHNTLETQTRQNNDATVKELSEVKFERVPADDLILSLADAYENQRARQVYEWELLRQQKVYSVYWR